MGFVNYVKLVQHSKKSNEMLLEYETVNRIIHVKNKYTLPSLKNFHQKNNIWHIYTKEWQHKT